MPHQKEQTSQKLTDYRPDIDGIRAIAVLAVVIFHAFPTQLQGGFVGVDVFFVISGFLITSIILRNLQRKNFSFIHFYSKRIIRIFPALILVLAGSLIIGWHILLPDEYKLLGLHTVAGVGFIQNIVLYRESGYFDLNANLKPLLHLWSLAIEEQFYLFYPLLVWTIWHCRLKPLLLKIMLSLGLISILLNLYIVNLDSSAAFFLIDSRIWELMAGGILAYHHFFKNPTRLADRLCQWLPLLRAAPDKFKNIVFSKNMFSGVGLLLIIVATSQFQDGAYYPGWRAILPVCGAVLLIHAGPNAWINRKILAHKWLVAIGLISYPLYLWHWPLLSFVHIVTVGKPSFFLHISALVLSFTLAWLTYRLVEYPLRFKLQYASWKKACLCAFVLIFIAGAAVHSFTPEMGFPKDPLLPNTYDWQTS